MESLNELIDMYNNCTDEKRAYVVLSLIEDVVKAAKENIKPILEQDELGVTEFKELGKTFSLIEIQKATLKEKEIKEQLSDEECRAGLKITETMLKNLKRKDLLTEDYKTVELVRQVRVSTIKEKESA